MLNKDALYDYAIRYRGNYDRIEQAILRQEPFYIEENKVPCLIYGTKNYPRMLYDLKNPPWVLFYEGNVDLLNKPMISIVGSRKLSDYGRKVTKTITQYFSKEYVVVSGMAIGTDYIAQIHSNETIGVIASGLDFEYPKGNHDLYLKCRKNGLLLSEYPLGVNPEKYYFPFRNRIIAALGEKLIIPSARIKGGTMITVNEALELGKEIYTVPYPIDDVTGKGCNLLIQEGANIYLGDEFES